jgi:hypothetical protein
MTPAPTIATVTILSPGRNDTTNRSVYPTRCGGEGIDEMHNWLLRMVEEKGLRPAMPD